MWATLTQPSRLAHWLGAVVAGSVADGSSFAVDHGDGYVCASTLLAVDPVRTLAYTWRFPDEPETRVSWVLEPDGDATTLQLTHDGLGDLVSSYVDGWITHLVFLEATALDAPLPTSMFWRIHGTIARLAQLR